MIEKCKLEYLKIKNESGITILVLVVTIIIILIIAGISIWTLTGDKNVINQSMEARNQTVSKDIEEEVMQQWLLVQNDTKSEYPTNEELAQKLQARLSKSDNNVEVTCNSNIDIFEIVYKGQSLLFDKNGNINIANEQTVLFDANGGYVGTKFKNVVVDQEYGELPTPTRNGYTFLGWNGKNKFDKSKYLKLGDFNINSNYYVWNEMKLKPNQTYKISVKRYNNFNGKISYLLVSKSKSPSGKWSAIAHSLEPNASYADIPYQYALNDSGILNIGYYQTMTQDNLDTIWENTDVQIEEGTEATEYEPYYVTSDTKVTQNQKHTLTAQWQKNE